MNQLIELAKSVVGFEEAGILNIAKLEFLSEVRDMCSANRCNMYGKSWMCPPACGSLEECKKNASSFTGGILVQTVQDLEDEFDYESMMEAERIHKAHFFKLNELLGDRNRLSLAAGACTICKKCTYPDSPCRFPNRAMASMEAYGVVVADICNKSNLKYNYGANTICYTSCILINDEEN